MLTTATIQSLQALFELATKQTEQLFVLLEQEQQALLAEDHDSLEKLIEQKLRLSQSLDHIEIQRQEIMLKADAKTDQKSMQDFLDAHQKNSTIKPLFHSWNALVDALTKAADQNQINGILLEKQRQHVKRALNILFEQTNSSSIYDASGGTAAPEYTRSVGIA